MYNNTRRPTSGKVPIRFGTYNIHNGRKGRLERALRGMSQANMDLGIPQETKLTDGIYTRGSAGIIRGGLMVPWIATTVTSKNTATSPRL